MSTAPAIAAPSRPAWPAVWVVLGLLLLAALVFTPLLGSTSLGDWRSAGGWQILWNLRVPRTLLAALAGAGLAAAGCAYQAIFRNPLAEPYTLGIAGGSALGAFLATLVVAQAKVGGADLPAWMTATVGSVPTGAMLGALAVTAIVWSLAGVLRQYGSGTLLLAGVAVGYICSALIMVLQIQTRPELGMSALRWAIGSVEATWHGGQLAGAGLWVAVGAGILLLRHRGMDLLMMGELLAASRGLAVTGEKLILGLSASVMTAGIVAHCGPIAFVGLVVPHALRRFTGPTHARLLPACLLGGALFLVLCDTLARSASAGGEFPVGVVCNLIGGLFFFGILLLGRSRRPA